MAESQLIQYNKRLFIRSFIKAFYCNFSVYQILYPTRPFNRLPEDEHSGSKHVEGIIKLRLLF